MLKGGLRVKNNKKGVMRMKKFLLVSFILCSFYGFSEKVSTPKNNTSVTGNKTKNIGEMTIKETIEKLSESDKKKFKEIDLEKKEQKEVEDLTRKELNELGINKKSIETTFKAIEIQDDYEEAKKLFLQAIEEDKKNYLPYYYLGILVYQQENNIKRSMEYFEKAIEANPKNPMAYNNLAVRYGQVNMEKEQLALVKKMIKLFPDFPEGYFSLAAIHFRNKNYLDSIKYVKLAIEKYKKMNKLDYSYITESLKNKYEADAYYLLFLNYIGMEKYDEAFENSKEAYIFMAQKDNELRYTMYDTLVDIAQEIKKTNKTKYKEYSAVLNSLQFAEQLVKANKDLQERKSGDKQ